MNQQSCPGQGSFMLWVIFSIYSISSFSNQMLFESQWQNIFWNRNAVAFCRIWLSQGNYFPRISGDCFNNAQTLVQTMPGSASEHSQKESSGKSKPPVILLNKLSNWKTVVSVRSREPIILPWKRNSETVPLVLAWSASDLGMKLLNHYLLFCLRVTPLWDQ